MKKEEIRSYSEGLDEGLYPNLRVWLAVLAVAGGLAFLCSSFQ